MGTLSVDKILKTSQGAAEFTLPATDGTVGQVWQTDGSGQLSLNNISGISVSATTLTASGATTLSGAFTSLGIDDNANAIAITIDSSENVMIGPSGGGTPTVAGSTLNIFGDIDSVDGFRPIIRNLNTGTNAHSSLWLSVTGGGAGGGDPRLVFNIDNVANVFSMGVDNSDSDKFKISAGAALGTTDRMVINNGGAMTKPSQPCFFAYNGTNVPNATGDNTLYGPIIYTTESYDQANNYDIATGTFTAPVDGRYLIQAALSTGTQSSAHTDGTFDLITSNKSVSVYYDPGAMEGSAFTGQCTIQSSGVFDMDAGDTATTKIRIAGSTKNIDISTNNTWFSGFLVA